MALRLYNTLSGKIEEFHPLQTTKSACMPAGPRSMTTATSATFAPLLRSIILHAFLRQSGFSVHHVMNITDVDDKIIRNSARDGLGVKDYTAKYEKAFLEDSNALEHRAAAILVRATDHIQKMAQFIAELEKKGFAYRAEDGSYYFRIAKFPGYGKLSKKDFAGMEDGARVDVDEYEKDNARDFALWKAPKPGEASWESAIGPGRPGWHIECSVMSMEESGRELRPARRRRRSDFPASRKRNRPIRSLDRKAFCPLLVSRPLSCWSKARRCPRASGNFFTLRDLVLKGYKPSSIRFLLASVPYRNQLNFTFDGLQQAGEYSVERLRNFQLRLTTGQFPDGHSE